jgi:hypothetical protein
MLLEAIAGVSP